MAGVVAVVLVAAAVLVVALVVAMARIVVAALVVAVALVAIAPASSSGTTGARTGSGAGWATFVFLVGPSLPRSPLSPRVMARLRFLSAPAGVEISGAVVVAFVVAIVLLVEPVSPRGATTDAGAE
jgi:hypothetical protein